MTTPRAPTRTPHQATVAPDDSPPEPATRRHSELMLVQRALPAAQRVIRHAVARWLEAAHWPEDGVEDVTLAVTEAVTNVVEHAYHDHDPGSIHLYAWITPAARPVTPDGIPASPATGGAPKEGRKVTVVVSDNGRWHPERRTVDLNGHRGRGIAMMTALMAAVHVQRASNGTTVVLVSSASLG